MTAALLILAPFLPFALALACVPFRTCAYAAGLMPLAPLPALAVAILGEPGFQLLLPNVLLGLELGFDGPRRLVLGFTALLWLAAAVYGRGYFTRDGSEHRYNALFLITMGGNLGLIVALDVPGFYLFFSLMTLSSYILVVFDRTPEAYRAGRVYIVLSLIGETALLVGFLRAVATTGSMLIAHIPPALAGTPGHKLTLFLLFAGFGIKAGQLPLHVWLPLAHAAAPTPASAVLSGAMIKAGLLGMILFLPVGETGLPAFGLVLAAIGMATAFYGVACGLPQANPKTVLAYSSLSQMGVMVGGLGAVVAAPATAAVLVPAIVLYAVHHGLAKGALFLGVGVIQRSGRGAAGALTVAALCAFAIAGAPLTAGALAKLSLKGGLEAAGGDIATSVVALLSFSSLATALLMLRFLVTVSRQAGSKSSEGAGALLWTPYLAVAALSQILLWSIALAERSAVAELALSIYGLWETVWPPAAALIVAACVIAVARRSGRVRLPPIPPGDILALLPGLPTRTAPRIVGYRLARFLRGTSDRAEAAAGRLPGAVERAEQVLNGQAANAFVVVLVVLGLVASLLI